MWVYDCIYYNYEYLCVLLPEVQVCFEDNYIVCVNMVIVCKCKNKLLFYIDFDYMLHMFL